MEATLVAAAAALATIMLIVTARAVKKERDRLRRQFSREQERRAQEIRDAVERGRSEERRLHVA